MTSFLWILAILWFLVDQEPSVIIMLAVVSSFVLDRMSKGDGRYWKRVSERLPLVIGFGALLYYV